LRRTAALQPMREQTSVRGHKERVRLGGFKMALKKKFAAKRPMERERDLLKLEC
jgi:hypothetical protein